MNIFVQQIVESEPAKMLRTMMKTCDTFFSFVKLYNSKKIFYFRDCLYPSGMCTFEREHSFAYTTAIHLKCNDSILCVSHTQPTVTHSVYIRMLWLILFSLFCKLIATKMGNYLWISWLEITVNKDTIFRSQINYWIFCHMTHGMGQFFFRTEIYFNG